MKAVVAFVSFIISIAVIVSAYHFWNFPIWMLILIAMGLTGVWTFLLVRMPDENKFNPNLLALLILGIAIYSWRIAVNWGNMAGIGLLSFVSAPLFVLALSISVGTFLSNDEEKF